MPDIGTLVTDAEIFSFAHGTWSQVGNFNDAEKVIIRGVEAKLKRACGLDFISDEFTEDITIELAPRQDGFLVFQRDRFVLRRPPIQTFEELLWIIERDATTGLPTQTAVIPRNSYVVDMDTGLVRLQTAPIPLSSFDVYPMVGFPEGIAIMQASYTGFSATVPADLKLLAIKIMVRLHGVWRNHRWGQTSVAGPEGSSSEYPDVFLTADESGELDMFRTGFFA